MWPSLTGGSGIGRIREAWRFLRGLPPYDGGSLDRRNSGWSPIDGTGEAVNQLSRDLVRARARDLERNSDTVCAIIEALERNVVGSGIKLQAKVTERGWTRRSRQSCSNGITEGQIRKKNRRVAASAWRSQSRLLYSTAATLR